MIGSTSWKPHIARMLIGGKFRWGCSSGVFVRCGETPREAYMNCVRLKHCAYRDERWWAVA